MLRDETNRPARMISFALPTMEDPHMPDNAPLRSGDPAPDFELMDENKNKVKLSDLRGKKVVLLFYRLVFCRFCRAGNCRSARALPSLTAGSTEPVSFALSGTSPFYHALLKKKSNSPSPLLSAPPRRW